MRKLLSGLKKSKDRQTLSSRPASPSQPTGQDLPPSLRINSVPATTNRPEMPKFEGVNNLRPIEPAISLPAATTLPTSMIQQADANEDSPIDPSGYIGVSILNSQFQAGRDNNIEISNDSMTHLQRLKSMLNPINAAYYSYEADQRSKCFENTRVQVLSDIETWMCSGGDQPPIFVLDGVAGIGKSTIAQTIAERAAALGLLGASFFFTRNEEERTTAKHFFPTIAFQLARYSESFAQQIAQALEQDPDASQKTILRQISLLSVDPLKCLLLQREPTILIVIDALDECREEEAQTLLLLAQYIPHMPQLRLFVTARPEWHIRDILDRDTNHNIFRLHEIDNLIVQSDIRCYLDFSLSIEHVERLFPHRRPTWQASQKDMKMLCGICGTLFIIASTATKFILDTKAANPERRLARLLDGVSPTDFSGSKRTDVMDKFYLQIILHAVPEDDVEEIDEWFHRYQTILGAIIVLQSPLPCRVLARLLHVDPADIVDGLLHLHSLVAPSGLELIFRIHHKSFPDFITSTERIQRALSKLPTVTSDFIPKLAIDIKFHHHRIALACLQLMNNNLKWNMANLSAEESFVANANIIGPQDTSFPEELVYAASHWASHIRAAGELDAELQDNFEKWAFNHVMAWLEIMNLLDQLDRAHDILDMALQSMESNSQGWPAKERVYGMMSDTRRFLLQSRDVLTLTPMQMYWSALPFVPQNSLLYRAYGGASFFSVVSGIEEEWDPAALVTITGHSDSINRVVFSSDGSRLASSADDTTVQLWDGKTGAHITKLCGHSQYVTDVMFSPDGTKLASSSQDHTIRLWHVQTGVCFTTLSDHSDGVRAVTFSPDGSRLSSASDDHTIQLYNGRTGAHISTLDGHSAAVLAVMFSPDGSRLASASDDHKVILWDVKAGALLIPLEGHSDSVVSIAFSPDGSKLASGSDDHAVRLWDRHTGVHIITLGGHSECVRDIAFSPDGSRLASASDDQTIRIWNGTTGGCVSTLRGHSSSVLALAYFSDGSRLASASYDNTVRLWDATTHSPITTFGGHSRGVFDVVVSPDGSRVASASDDETIRLWDGQAGAHVTTLVTHSSFVLAVAFSHDGSRFASSSDDCMVHLLAGQTGAHIATLRGHSAPTLSVAFSPDSSRLASVSDDETIRLWHGKTGAHLATFSTSQSRFVWPLAFSPDGSRLASASSDKNRTIHLWDGTMGTSNHFGIHSGHSSTILALSFSRDGSRIASTCENDTIRLWDVKTGSHIATLSGHAHQDRVGVAAFSPSRSILVSASKNTFCLWRNRDMIGRIDSLQEHFTSIISVAFLPPHSALSLPSSTSHNSGASHIPDVAIPTPPLRMVFLGLRANPSLSGLVYIKISAEGVSAVLPFCWFPPHLNAAVIGASPTGSSIAVGCEDGRFMLLDISRVPLV